MPKHPRSLLHDFARSAWNACAHPVPKTKPWTIHAPKDCNMPFPPSLWYTCLLVSCIGHVHFCCVGHDRCLHCMFHRGLATPTNYSDVPRNIQPAPLWKHINMVALCNHMLRWPKQQTLKRSMATQTVVLQPDWDAMVVQSAPWRGIGILSWEHVWLYALYTLHTLYTLYALYTLCLHFIKVIQCVQW